jgi:methylated-DNA-[protein]-cysteine S-methyltransferase
MRAGHDRATDAGEVAAPRLAICVRTVKTPIGVLRVAASEDSVLAVELPRRRSEPALERWLRSHVPHSAETEVLRAALVQLREYFAGKRRQFDVPVDPAGTDFQRRVWNAIAAIPYGETTSYGKIAVALGSPARARAVGAAVSANPIPIVIPCHRVIGADDSLTGYRGGLRMKVWLLHHEGVLLA